MGGRPDGQQVFKDGMWKPYFVVDRSYNQGNHKPDESISYNEIAEQGMQMLQALFYRFEEAQNQED